MSSILDQSSKSSADDSLAIETSHHPRTMVQIPTDTLNILLSSIESLRNDVSVLQGKVSSVSAELSTVSSELDTLQKNTGVTFPLFIKFPPELRTIIWQHALTSTPQIHILGEDMCTRSIVNAVAQSCKEAWNVLEGLELDYLLIKLSEGSQIQSLEYKSYVNLDIDTFWLNLQEEAYIPFTVKPRCGKCSFKLGVSAFFILF